MSLTLMNDSPQSSGSDSETVSPFDPVAYRIDQDGLITWVNEAWQNFAAKNGGETIMGDRMIGKSVWECVVDNSLRSIYKLLVQRAKEGIPVCYRYRCDAPDRRRWLAMTISNLASGELEFESTLLREETRESVPLLELHRPRGEHFVRICSWCQMMATEYQGWLPVEKAVEVSGILEEEEFPKITHTICPRCQKVVMGQFGSGH